jgi:hypothetical protein
MTTYAIQYQLHDQPCGTHRTLSGASRELRRCRRHARAGGDTQGIQIIIVSPVPADDDDIEAVAEANMASSY